MVAAAAVAEEAVVAVVGAAVVEVAAARVAAAAVGMLNLIAISTRLAQPANDTRIPYHG